MWGQLLRWLVYLEWPVADAQMKYRTRLLNRDRWQVCRGCVPVAGAYSWWWFPPAWAVASGSSPSADSPPPNPSTTASDPASSLALGPAWSLTGTSSPCLDLGVTKNEKEPWLNIVEIINQKNWKGTQHGSVKGFIKLVPRHTCLSLCRGARVSMRKSLKDVLFNALKVWKWGFVKSKKVWNQINPFHTRFWNLHRLCTGSTRFP